MEPLFITLGALLTIAAGIIGAILGRRDERERWERRLIEHGIRPSDLHAVDSSRQIDRYDGQRQSADATVEAIALEVERIAEGQRFLTKLMLDRGNVVQEDKKPPDA